jgi:uncharacterized protein (DUF736 family)
VRFVRLEKGADYAVHGPDDGELGAAWRKSGDYGDYLSVKLDLKASVPPPRMFRRLLRSADETLATTFAVQNPKDNR